MPRFYFDVHDGSKFEPDETGTECDRPEDARAAAMRFLPDLAREEVPEDGDHRSFVVLVTDEQGKPVYSATLSYIGVWLTEHGKHGRVAERLRRST